MNQLESMGSGSREDPSASGLLLITWLLSALVTLASACARYDIEVWPQAITHIEGDFPSCSNCWDSGLSCKYPPIRDPAGVQGHLSSSYASRFRSGSCQTRRNYENYQNADGLLPCPRRSSPAWVASRLFDQNSFFNQN